jgi:hypothetical protein
LQVVTRGSGTGLERTYVLAALLRQLNVECVLVGDPEAATRPDKIWAVAVRNGEEWRLFDARAGIALPGTLADLVRDSVKLKLWIDAGYDVSTERIAAAKHFPAHCMLAYAPRMRFLESMMPALAVRLAMTYSGTLNVTPWSAATYGTPLRVLAEVLLPEDGGRDSAEPGRRRGDIYRSELVRWSRLPTVLADLPGPFGQRMQQVYAVFSTLAERPGIADMLKQKQLSKEALGSEAGDIADPKARAAMLQSGEQRFRPTFREDAGPSLRQLILRGQYEEATAALVLLGDKLRTEGGRMDGQKLAQAAASWIEKVPSAYAEYLRAQRSRDPLATAQAESKVESLLRESAPAAGYVQWLAMGPALGDVAFLTALCKLDQAEARCRRQPDAEATLAAARTAAQNWTAYLNEFPDSPAAGQAQRLLARSLLLSGQPQAAADAYKKAAAKLPGPEKVACLMLAN